MWKLVQNGVAFLSNEAISLRTSFEVGGLWTQWGASSVVVAAVYLQDECKTNPGQYTPKH